MLLSEAEAATALADILSELRISRDNVVYLGCDMSRLPLPNYDAALNRDAIRQRETRWCQFLLQGLMNVLGPSGTLLVPTFTYGYAAKKELYHHETTASETGPFTEFVRRHPGAIRSLHPIHSIAGIGRYASEILDNVGHAAYGAMSAFGRLSRYDTKFLCLGTTIGNSLTYVHHLEQIYGASHRYNKVFQTPVYRQGSEVPGPWLAYVRYLGVALKPEIANIEVELRAAGSLRESAINDLPNQCADVADVDRIGLAMLARDSCAFLPKPVRVFLDESGTLSHPTDGPEVRFKISLE